MSWYKPRCSFQRCISTSLLTTQKGCFTHISVFLGAQALPPPLCSKFKPSKDRTSSCRLSAQANPAPEVEVVAPLPGDTGTSLAESTPSQAGDSVTVGEEVLPNSHIRLTITVPATFVRKAYQRAMRKLRAETDVPGFRKGKKVHILASLTRGHMHVCWFPNSLNL